MLQGPTQRQLQQQQEAPLLLLLLHRLTGCAVAAGRGPLKEAVRLARGLLQAAYLTLVGGDQGNLQIPQ